MAGTPLDQCTSLTREQLQYDIDALQVDHVDLMLLHGTNSDFSSGCDQKACDLDYAQWQVYEEFYSKGKAKAIGVSNFCVSCLECLLSKKDLKVKPVLNQIQYHVGMGSDSITQSLLSELKKDDILPQVLLLL